MHLDAQPTRVIEPLQLVIADRSIHRLTPPIDESLLKAFRLGLRHQNVHVAHRTRPRSNETSKLKSRPFEKDRPGRPRSRNLHDLVTDPVHHQRHRRRRCVRLSDPSGRFRPYFHIQKLRRHPRGDPGCQIEIVRQFDHHQPGPCANRVECHLPRPECPPENPHKLFPRLDSRRIESEVLDHVSSLTFESPFTQSDTKKPRPGPG